MAKQLPRASHADGGFIHDTSNTANPAAPVQTAPVNH
jgi:hypothetical protein